MTYVHPQLYENNTARYIFNNDQQDAVIQESLSDIILVSVVYQGE